MNLDLSDAVRLLTDGARIRVPHDLGTVEANVVMIDCRGRVPALIARTDAGREIPIPLADPAAVTL